MRLSVRLSISLVLGVALVSMAFALYQTQSERHGLKRELERHATELAESLERAAAPVERTIQLGSSNGEFSTLAGEPVHIIALPIRVDSIVLGALAILHDAGYIETRSAAMWQRGLATVVVQTVLIVAVTLLMLRWGLGQPVEHLAAWLRDLRTGAVTGSARLPEEEGFKPRRRESTQAGNTVSAAQAGA